MSAPVIYHGTPITPAAALRDVCSGRALCVSYYRPDQVAAALEISPAIMFDNGAFSFWMQARRAGKAFAPARDWTPFFDWLEPRLFHPGRWAVIPDMPGAPPAMNDALVEQWPFGQAGAPIWHMDAPIERLLHLADAFGRICIAWTGERVGCDDYRRRMDQVSAALGNRWPVIHMLRGIAVAFDYTFESADSTSLGRNGWTYDKGFAFGDSFAGRRAYADRLESPRPRVSRIAADRGRDADRQLGLFA